MSKLPIFSRKRTLHVAYKQFKEAFENAITNQRPEAVGYAADVLRLYGQQLLAVSEKDVLEEHPQRLSVMDPLDSFMLKFYVGKGAVGELEELAGVGELHRVRRISDKLKNK